MLRLTSACALGAVCAVVGSAVAAVPPERVLSEYHAAPGCPGEFTFRAQVQARTERFELLPAEGRADWPSTPRFVVWLRQEGDGYAGTLEIVRGSVRSRSELQAKTCDEVVAGLSIAASLSGNEAEGSLPEAVPVQPVPNAPQAPPRQAPAKPVEARAQVSQSTSGYWLGAVTFQGRLGYSPRPGLAVGVLLGHSPAPLAGGVSYRAGLGITFADDVAGAGSPPLRLGFTWFGGAGDICPFGLATGAAAALLPCVSLELGALHAAGTNGETSLRPWVAPGLALRFSAKLGGLLVEPALAARLPLLRDRYWFRPDTLAFRVPALAVEASLAGGIVF